MRLPASLVAETRLMQDQPADLPTLSGTGDPTLLAALVDGMLIRGGSSAAPHLNRIAPPNRHGWATPIRHG